MLYGIVQDANEEDKPMGLTFGPATGADYTKTYKSHVPRGNDANGNPHRCIHNDDWRTIIEWNNKDPYVYEQCIDNDCTHSVNLTPTNDQVGVTFANNYADYTSTGDGPGMLYNELSSKTWNSSSSDSMNYAGSRIRAMLNGHDSHTVDSLAGSDSANYTANTCLLAAFPTELQNAIGKKAVHYATSYQARDSDNVIYDKLWLFSNKEIFGDSIRDCANYGSSPGDYNYTAEGTQYKRFSDAGIIAQNAYIKILSNYTMFTCSLPHALNFSTHYDWWLRSLYNYPGAASSIDNNLNELCNTNIDSDHTGVAPGFALSR